MSDNRPEWAQTLERIAHGLEVRKGMPHISEPHLELFIGQLRNIAAMDLASLEKSGVCETCESEAVKRADSLESDLDAAITFRKSRERELGNRIAEQDLEIERLQDGINNRENLRETTDENGRLIEWLKYPRCEHCGHVDEGFFSDGGDFIEADIQGIECPECGKETRYLMGSEPGFLHMPNEQSARMSETNCPCNDCALEDPYVDIAACREDVMARDDGSCGYPEWTRKDRQETP